MCPTSVGGRLQRFAHLWKSIDNWSHCILSEGYKLQLFKEPTQHNHFAHPLTRAQHEAITEHVHDLLKDNAIEKVTKKSDFRFGIVSPLFCVKKKGTKKLRPCLNLKKFNDCTIYKKFKMEGISTLRDIIRPHDFMTKVDLSKAYHHIPIHPDFRKYLQFCWEGVRYQFLVLPFGLQSAPRIFTKILRPVLGVLRAQGIRIVAYLDDLIILSRSRKTAKRDCSMVVKTLQELGFLINHKKSVLTPAKKMEFLGVLVNSKNMSLNVPKKKLKKFLREAKQVYNRTNRHKPITLRKLAGLIGKLNSMSQAMEGTELHIRGLQWALAHGTSKVPVPHLSWEAHIHLHHHHHALTDLEWWARQAPLWNGRTIMQRRQPDKIIYTDASDTGYAGVLQTTRTLQTVTQGTWTHNERQTLSINARELLAISRTVRGLVKHKKWRNKHILVYTDNMVSKWIINKHTTKAHDMFAIVTRLIQHCLKHNIHLTANHIPGIENTVADRGSRRTTDASDWQLNPTVFRVLDQLWGPHTVDWTATRLNTQLPRFCSWLYDPRATYIDVLKSLNARENGWANPPFSLIGRILQAVRVRRVTLTLIAPVWKAQPWWPVLMSMCIDYPRIISDPHILDDLLGGYNTEHLYHHHHHGNAHNFLFIPPPHRAGMSIRPPSWQVGAFRISGKSSLSKAFRSRCWGE